MKTMMAKNSKKNPAVTSHTKHDARILPRHCSCGEEVDGLNECLHLVSAPRRHLAACSTLAPACSAPLRQLQLFLFLSLRFLVQNSHLCGRHQGEFLPATLGLCINGHLKSLQNHKKKFRLGVGGPAFRFRDICKQNNYIVFYDVIIFVFGMFYCIPCTNKGYDGEINPIMVLPANR